MTAPNRRNFLACALRGAAGVSLAQFGSQAFAQAGPARVAAKPLADNLFLLSGAGANVIARTGADGVLLVDGGKAENAAELARAVAALPGGRAVHTLFNTHWHPEQTGSNIPLAKAGATIIAHANTRLWLTRNITRPGETVTYKRLPPEALPKKTFYDKGEIAVDGERVQYGYMLQSHTDGDAYVFFPKANVLAIGDVICGNAWPFVDWWTGGWINGIVSGLDTVLKVVNADTRVVPARGPVLAKADLDEQRKMFNTIAQRLRTLMFGGKSLNDAIAADPTKEFNSRFGDPKEFVRQSFESMWPHFTPDA